MVPLREFQRYDGPLMIEQSTHSALELLRWYSHCGVDMAMAEHPVNQFEAYTAEIKTQKAKPQKPKLAKTTPPRKSMPVAEIPDETVIENARQLAKSANSLEALRKILDGFKGCNLRLNAKHLVFGGGDPNARLMLVAEAPGREEDMHGLPFVGPAGQLLERMLAAIGLQREEIYISNIIPWRPPGNRAPTAAETAICRPFIERHIELVAPKVVVLLGGAASKTLLNTDEGIVKLRGKWKKYEFNGNEIDALPIQHPSHLLRQPVQKKLAWRDLLKIKARLGDK